MAKRTLILLDYDDTLCPSSWVLEEAMVVVEKTTVAVDMRNGGHAEAEEIMHLVSESQKLCVSKLETCAIDLILSILGNTEDGSVMLKIVTNGDAAWLRQSLRSFLPLMDQYLQHHQVEVVSARDRYEESYPTEPIQWKIFCFRDEIRSAMELFRDRMVREETSRRQLLPSPSQTSKEAGSASASDADADDDVEMTASEMKAGGGWTQQSTPSSMSSISMSVEMLSGKSDETESERMVAMENGDAPKYQQLHSPSSPQTAAEAAVIVPPAIEMLVVSIGDGQHERQASHFIANEVDVGCVSIKLLESPSPGILARELGLVKDNLGKICEHYWDRYRATCGSAEGSREHGCKGEKGQGGEGRTQRFNSNLDLQVCQSSDDGHLVIGNYLSEGEMSEGEQGQEQQEQQEVMMVHHRARGSGNSSDGDRGKGKKKKTKKEKKEKVRKREEGEREQKQAERADLLPRAPAPDAAMTTSDTIATAADGLHPSQEQGIMAGGYGQGQSPHEKLHRRAPSGHNHNALFTFFRDLPLDCDGPPAEVGERRKRSWSQWEDEDEAEQAGGSGGGGGNRYSSADATEDEGEDEGEDEDEDEDEGEGEGEGEGAREDQQGMSGGDEAFSPDSSAGSSAYHFFRENAVPAPSSLRTRQPVSVPASASASVSAFASDGRPSASM